ncbi:MAG: glycosyltransferase family 4 protein [Planctomycetes bacterium]|nr:glycosyltransferase family 4 protein [Planctomycetota bacterium]
MHIAIITAGGAGMFCGSCMHDNTLARALLAAGHEVSLIPTYTPIRVDEQNVSTPRVFLGGINVYLAALFPFWNRLPRWITRWLDANWVLRLAARLAINTSASKLGKLTVAMLAGDDGPEARQIDEFADYLGGQLRPDVVMFSNALLAGLLPRLKRVYNGRIVCLLQGDDIFLNDLIEPYRTQAFRLLRQHVQVFDRFLTHSEYYRDYMADQLAISPDRVRVVPLGIDLQGHDGQPRPEPGKPFTIGYFARVCPEKGLHLLVQAFRLVHQEFPETRLLAGGYLGARDKAYFDELTHAARDLGEAFQYVGSPPDHAGKVNFLKQLDAFSVPTTYREPKGLSVLEALANGIPVVQPRHGAFPELIAATGGGLLCEPDNLEDLAKSLMELIGQPELRRELAQRGHNSVHTNFGVDAMVARTVAALQ